MDFGTLHLILNAHHLVGGTVDLDTMIQKVMKESDPRQSKLGTDTDTKTHVLNKSHVSVRGTHTISDNKSNTCMNRESHVYRDTNSHDFSKMESHVVSANKLHVVRNRETQAAGDTKSRDFTNRASDVLSDTTSHVFSDTNSHVISDTKSNVFTNRKSDVLFCDTTPHVVSDTNSRVFNNISAHHSQSQQLTCENPTYPVHNTEQMGHATYRVAVSSDISEDERAHSYIIHTQDGERPSMCCKRTQNSDTDDGEVTLPKLRNISSRGKNKSCQIKSIDRIKSSVITTQQDEHYDVSVVERIIQTLVKAQQVFEMPIDDEDAGSSTKQGHGSKGNYTQLQDKHPETNASPRPDVRENEDVSGIMDNILMLIQRRIIQTVKFAKLIPGFTDLNVDDMLALLKASKSECQMIESSVFDWKNSTINTSSKDKLSMQTLVKYMPKEYLERRILVAMELGALHLTERETAVLRAVVITFTDRVDLSDRESAAKLHNQMCTCLRHVVGHGQYQNVTTRLNEIDNVLRYMKESTESYTHLLEDVLQKSNILNRYKVIKEYMNL